MKRQAIVTARPKTYIDSVSSPTVPGARETLPRVFDVIEWMYRRKQIDQWAYRAANKVLAAQEKLSGTVGNVMDFERIRGAALPGVGPHDGLIDAAMTMRTLRNLVDAGTLSAVQLACIKFVVCENYTIEKTAQKIFCNFAPTRKEREQTSKTFRSGLHALADHWWPEGKGEHKNRILGFRNENARPSELSEGVIEVGSRVYVSG